jgi:GNAT superfamily N-acetyltransferase
MSDWLNIRGTSASDITEILYQRKGMFRDMGFTDQFALDEMQRTSEQFIRAALTNGSYHQWFAEVAGTCESRVVGGVAVLTYSWVTSPTNFRPEKAYILNLYVYPEFRRKGVARKLMETAIKWCLSQHFASVDLHASEIGALLYQKLGFKATNEMRLELQRASDSADRETNARKR